MCLCVILRRVHRRVRHHRSSSDRPRWPGLFTYTERRWAGGMSLDHLQQTPRIAARFRSCRSSAHKDDRNEPNVGFSVVALNSTRSRCRAGVSGQSHPVRAACRPSPCRGRPSTPARRSRFQLPVSMTRHNHPRTGRRHRRPQFAEAATRTRAARTPMADGNPALASQRGSMQQTSASAHFEGDERSRTTWFPTPGRRASL